MGDDDVTGAVAGGALTAKGDDVAGWVDVDVDVAGWVDGPFGLGGGGAGRLGRMAEPAIDGRVATTAGVPVWLMCEPPTPGAR